MFDDANYFKAEVHYTQASPNALDIKKALQKRLDRCKTSKNCHQPLVLADNNLLQTKSTKLQPPLKTYKPSTTAELKKLVNNQHINLDDIDTSLITDMSYLFENSKRTNFKGIESWDVSNVTNMGGMFHNAAHFNEALNSLDVSNVYDMHWMFKGARSFNQPLDKWDVSKVKDMGGMFQEATSFNQPLNTWNLTNLKSYKSMFYKATSFNQDLSKWNLKSALLLFEEPLC
ncbi:BspA family leucine-rich repeat surface protein [Helicobacter sp. 11S02629-2]|uniref:BspA family leucine-rich repeat surface protein n=1 Tax=Helicobacter sp. 11S02629-2 TaxID=1476195 RepID=UPI000BA7B221|nr:BspA family leucine-rich repeat surface protein [Helicobacter sp. 11S02629-2]PAF42899.1 hypothetical protein BKH40_07490 [Helicobacter sp. 11S02629-2]